MELNDLLVTAVDQIMSLKGECSDTHVLLVDYKPIVNIRELHVTWPEAAHDKVRQKQFLHELSIVSEEVAIKSDLIINGKPNILVAVSFVHQSCDLCL